MQAEASSLHLPGARDALRAYELGRLATASWRALVVAVAVGLVALFTGGARAVPLALIPYAAWVFLHWRGGAVLRGARLGLLAGVATWLLPMSLLRPCCRPGIARPMAECCTQPAACVYAGLAVGVALAWMLPQGGWSVRARSAAGMALGAASIAVLKCQALVLGEALGLLGGLAVGVVLSGFGRPLVERAVRAAAGR